MKELSEKASVTPRTIRYYVSEGLLAPPETAGRDARYTEEHLARLELIKRLKAEFLPLREIASVLEELDGKTIQELARHKPKERPLDPRSLEWLSSSTRVKTRVASGRGGTRESGGLPGGATWQRIRLADGVELHVRSGPRPAETQRKIHKLVRDASEIFTG